MAAHQDARGYRPIVADNGSTDGSAEVAAAHGATVVHVPQRGFGAACHAGLLAATSDVVCFMDADGSFDPADLPPCAAGRERRADLVLGRRSADGAGRVARRTRGLATSSRRRLRRRAGVPLHDMGPMRAARRVAAARPAVADRRFGYPLEMVIRAAAADWRIYETRRPLLPAHRQVQGHRDGRRHREGSARHAQDPRKLCGVTSGEPSMTTANPLACQVVVIAKEPVPGPRQDAAHPAVLPGARPRRSPRRRLPTRSPRWRRRRSPAGYSRLRGRPGAWLPPRIRRGAAAGRRVSTSGSQPRSPTRTPRCRCRLLIGMDTPQVTPELLAEAAATRLRGGGRRVRPGGGRRVLAARPRRPGPVAAGGRADVPAGHRPQAT